LIKTYLFQQPQPAASEPTSGHDEQLANGNDIGNDNDNDNGSKVLI